MKSQTTWDSDSDYSSSLDRFDLTEGPSHSIHNFLFLFSSIVGTVGCEWNCSGERRQRLLGRSRLAENQSQTVLPEVVVQGAEERKGNKADGNVQHEFLSKPRDGRLTCPTSP